MHISIKILLLFVLTIGVMGCKRYDDKKKEDSKTKTSAAETQIVAEAGCGQCQFKLNGKDGCDLAVRIDGKAYFVDGASIDDFGDAHADDGLCMCVRKAKVKGEIKDGRFVATSFDVLPAKEKTKK